MDNDHSWNKLANMLYVEVPSGVGYSYSDTPSDYTVGKAHLVSRVDKYCAPRGGDGVAGDIRVSRRHRRGPCYRNSNAMAWAACRPSVQ